MHPPHSQTRILPVFAVGIVLAAGTVRAETESAPAVARRTASLSIRPARIELRGANRRQQLLVTLNSAGGREKDVSHQCVLSIADESVAFVTGAGVGGVDDGQTQLVVRFEGLEQRVPVVVEDFSVYPGIDFRNDVIPLFSKLGCNSGNCHGKQGGQNGFQLSVFGFDPQADYDTLVKASRGRRAFPGDPRRSLLVAKAAGLVPHGGGRRAPTGSADHQLLANWVRQGMPWGKSHVAKLESIEIEPTERILDVEADQQLLVTAHYSDGTTRDVTAAATYTSNADTLASVEQTGRVSTGHRPGEAAVTVNYMGQVGVFRALVPRPNAPETYPELPVHNRIDELVWARLKKLGIVPSDLANDATFLRRLYIDTIGTFPTPDEVREFLADNRTSKREAAIDAVLARPEFADYWANRWADVLLVDRQTLGDRGAYQFYSWLRQQMAANRPYDEWVRELLTATGSSGRYGPVNFFRALETKEDMTRAVSQALLGVRLDCAQCHHHPFEKWAQEDFYGLAGFFNGLERKELAAGRTLVYHVGYRETTMPRTGQLVPMRPPDGDVPVNLEDGDPRVHLARWMTAPQNPWFARLAANRLWKHFLGRGLVEPEDDLRTTNPATNEPLLAYLAEQVVAHDYDLKAVMKLILQSRVYQLSSDTNETNFDDEQNYSHYTVKRLPAEVLLDAICQVTAVPEEYPGMPAGTRAIELWDNRLPSYFLETFGRSLRQSPCECGKSSEPTMAQALHLMNAPEIESKITADDGRVARLIRNQADRERIVEELCLAALGRPPNEKELRIAADLFASGSTRQAAEDFLWTLLNSYDFVFVR